MKAFAQEWFRHIREPDNEKNQIHHRGAGKGREKYKQTARILKHLRNELNLTTPNLAKPTDAMIEHLVFNCPAPLFDSDDWPAVINAALLFLKSACDNTSPGTQHFTRQDGHTPLFPNNELYDEQDVYCFCDHLLRQLELDNN